MGPAHPSTAVPRPRGSRWVPATIILLLVFAYQILSYSGFPNDHFVYVARAQQMLLGAWPVRDFVDPGFTLMYAASAAGLAVFGHNLLGEALLVFGSFAVAAALSYGLVRMAAGSVVVAVLGVALQALAYPRSYSYPKLLLHALAITLIWNYLARPSLPRRVGLAALVAAGALARPDHGAVIGLAALIAILSAGQGAVMDRARKALGFAAVTTVVLLPWLIFVHTALGIVPYVRSVLGFTGRKVEVGALDWPPFPIDLSSLAGPAGGLDHEAFLYYTFLLLPVAGAAYLVRRGAAAAPMPDASRRLGIVVLIAVCLNATLLRDPLRNRLADVAVPQAILAGWLLSAAWRTVRQAPLAVRWAQRGGVAVLACLLALSVVRLGAAADRLGDIPILRPSAVLRRASGVAWGLREIQASTGLPKPTPLPTLVAYLRACTTPDDRAMYVGYAPETYFLAERGFAGGHVVFEGAYYASPEEQALTISRLQRERVPIVAMRDESTPDFRHTFTALAGYLDARYVRVGTLELSSDLHQGIYVDRRLSPTGVYEPLGLPCFRTG